eukprot:1157218-Pelagomonas_calceolata.AAC.11
MQVFVGMLGSELGSELGIFAGMLMCSAVLVNCMQGFMGMLVCWALLRSELGSELVCWALLGLCWYAGMLGLAVFYWPGTTCTEPDYCLSIV